MARFMTHPAQRFQAPRSIQRGVPLKDVLGPTAISLIAESFAAIDNSFDVSAFTTAATKNLEPLGILPRGDHIAAALEAQMQPERVAETLIAALGPALSVTEGFGLAVFFYLPHVALIRRALINRPEEGLRANYEITQRFSGEFSIRPFLLQHQEMTLATLERWARDPNPHVRRLVSEGSRPRLPWAERLPPFQKDPTATLALLEQLKDDPVLYVRRSVANHLGDIAKDHPERAFAVARQWLEESLSLPEATGEARRWVIRHALRHPAQKGVEVARRLRTAAGGR